VLAAADRANIISGECPAARHDPVHELPFPPCLVGAIRLGAIRVQLQRVLADRKTALLGHPQLPLFDLGVIEFFDPAALNAHEVIMMAALVQFEYRLARFEVMALQDSGVFELSQNAVHGGEPDIQTLVHEHAVDVFGGKMPHLAVLEQLEDAQSRPRCLQPDGFQVVDIGHAEGTPGADARFRYHITFYPVQIQAYVPRMLIPALPLFVAACGVFPGLTPYRIEVQQGNYVTKEMVAQLKPGLTRDQVRFVLGTPLMSDIFHGERWDYVFMHRPANSAEVEYRRLAVFFEDGKLKRFEGDTVAAAGAAASPKEIQQ